MKRKITVLLLTAVFIFTSAGFAAAANNTEIKVKIDNQILNLADKPVIVEGRTMLPVRAIAEALDCEVNYEANTRTVVIQKDGLEPIYIVIGNEGSFISLAGRTYVPLRYIAENLGTQVDWDGASRTVEIKTNISSGDGLAPDLEDGEDIIVLPKDEAFRNLKEYFEPGANESFHALDDIRVGNKIFYHFELVSLGGKGASTSFVVSPRTGNTYSNISDAIVSEIELSDFPYEIVRGKKIYVVDVAHGNDTPYKRYMSEDGQEYQNLEDAKSTILSEGASADPLLDLIHKDVAYAERKLGEKAKTIRVEAEYVLPGESEYDEFLIIDKGNYRIFFESNLVNYIDLRENAEVLGVKVGMTPSQIKGILGKPELEGTSWEWDDLYEMSYTINGVQITFYSYGQDSPTIAGYIRG